ncbi:MAG: NAD-dependent epimerase/dehydratase family protein [Actinomycetota bacterium]|nr:NAD-dependent epimerase/dehydratase family protein [Actinomycetota bacterium]
MKLLITGARGFLGSRSADVLEGRGHEVLRLSRPEGAVRAADGEQIVLLDAGDSAAQELVRDCDAVLHFAGVPDPARSRADPAWAVRQNAGTTLNLLEGCLEHGSGLVYPSSVRAALEPPPDPYAASKRLGEETCRFHAARATVLRLTSVYGPGQVAWEGATGAIAAFAARALEGEPIVIDGDPERTRDFVFVDDVVAAIESLLAAGRWNDTVTVATGRSTPLRAAAELVRSAAGSSSPIETPGGDLPPGENESYEGATDTPIGFTPLEEGIRAYVDWLASHPAAEGRARA